VRGWRVFNRNRRSTDVDRNQHDDALWLSIFRCMMRPPKCTKSSSALPRKTLTRWKTRPSNRCYSRSALCKGPRVQMGQRRLSISVVDVSLCETFSRGSPSFLFCGNGPSKQEKTICTESRNITGPNGCPENESLPYPYEVLQRILLV